MKRGSEGILGFGLSLDYRVKGLGEALGIQILGFSPRDPNTRV